MHKPPPRLTNAHHMIPGANIRVYHYHSVMSSGLHWHEFYELMLVISGAGVHWLNGQEWRLVPGSFCLLTPSDFHEVVPLAGQPLEFWNIIFTDALLRDVVSELLFDDVRIYHTEVTAAEIARLDADCKRLWAETVEARLGHTILVQSTLDQLLVALRRNIPAHATAPGSTLIAPEPIHRALRYLQRHFREPLTLPDVARHAGLSPAYFSDMFRRTTGTTFQTHVLRLRLHFASSLLVASDLPVTDVCFAAGFNSLSHFMRAFKQQFGVAPRAYRQQAHAGVALPTTTETQARIVERFA